MLVKARFLTRAMPARMHIVQPSLWWLPPRRLNSVQSAAAQDGARQMTGEHDPATIPLSGMLAPLKMEPLEQDHSEGNLQDQRQSTETTPSQQLTSELWPRTPQQVLATLPARASESEASNLVKMPTGRLYNDDEIDEAFNNLFPNEAESAETGFAEARSNQFMSPRAARRLSIPFTLREVIEKSDINSFAVSHETGTYDWDAIMLALKNSETRFHDIPRHDVLHFLNNMPISVRAKYGMQLLEMMEEANIEMGKMPYNLFLEAYASKSDKAMAQGIYNHMRLNNIAPGDYTYFTMMKLYYNLNDFKSMSLIVDRMNEIGMPLSLHHYSIIMRMCFKLRRMKELNEIFDLMKFSSVRNLPDANIYSIMITASGAMRETERALDLYTEMTTRPIQPQEPTAFVLSSLIYALSKRPEYGLRAWEALLEFKERGFLITKSTMNQMLYICAMSGDITYARIILLQMCVDSKLRPNSVSFHHLMRAYSLHFARRPGMPGILSGEMALAIRKAFLPSGNLAALLSSHDVPPLLPLSTLADKDQVIAESRAVLLYLQLRHQDIINSQLINSYISVAVNIRQRREFRVRLAETTVSPMEAEEGWTDAAYIGQVGKPKELTETGDIKFETDDNFIDSSIQKLRRLTDSRFTVKVRRNCYIYETAMEGAYLCIVPQNQDLRFAEALFEEYQAAAAYVPDLMYPRMNEDDIEAADRTIISLMLKCYARAERFDQAANLLRNTAPRLKYKFENLSTLYVKARQAERDDIRELITSVLKSQNEQHLQRRLEELEASSLDMVVMETVVS
ncbi:uncharacterized protein V1518DRAFT_388879 [Limtongia smithiae]|uniref:uncharacterized protein n=1 Tax=Limtongia smithiae TaxID=1125753 RepID=UPI0034CE366F